MEIKTTKEILYIYDEWHSPEDGCYSTFKKKRWIAVDDLIKYLTMTGDSQLKIITLLKNLSQKK